MDNPVFLILFLVIFFGIIAIIAYVLYRVLKLNKADRGRSKSEEEVASEELRRVLEPIEDDKIKKQMNDYKKDK